MTNHIQLPRWKLVPTIYLGAINYKYSKMSNKNPKSMLLFQNLNIGWVMKIIKQLNLYNNHFELQVLGTLLHLLITSNALVLWAWHLSFSSFLLSAYAPF